jgi:hypothetical protein
MHISALEAAIQFVVDSPETRRKHVSPGQQHCGVEEGVLEVGITGKELLSQEAGILDMLEQTHPQRMLEQVRQSDALHLISCLQ